MINKIIALDVYIATLFHPVAMIGPSAQGVNFS